MLTYQTSVGSISFKLILFFIILVLDIIITSFVTMKFTFDDFDKGQAIAILVHFLLGY